jgi:hypothetical protein
MASAHNQPVPSPQPSAGIASNSPDGIVFLSASRSQTGGPGSDGIYLSDEMYNPVCKGVRLYVDVTVPNGGTVTVKIQTRDPFTDKWVNLTAATTGAIATTITPTLTVYPGITVVPPSATVNTETSNFLSLSWRIVATVATAAVTFSIGAEYLL